MRIGRVINKLFGGKFKPSDIEVFVNEYKSEHDMMTGNIDIELVEGDDITYWYDYKKYAPGGTLGKSCMRDVGSRRLQMYSDNPEVIKLAIYKRHDKLEARALVWVTDKGMFMDRRYYTKDHLDNAFQSYAKKKGWMYKGQNGLNKLTVKLKHNKSLYGNTRPYLDTFTYNRNGTLTAYG